MDDDKTFFSWYKRKIADNPQDPPEDAWQNISEELDLNDVWEKVAVRLDGDGGWFTRKTLYYSLPVLLLLLLSGGLYFHFDRESSGAHPPAGISPAEHSANGQSLAESDAAPAPGTRAGRRAEINETRPGAARDLSVAQPDTPRSGRPSLQEQADTRQEKAGAAETISPAKGIAEVVPQKSAPVSSENSDKKRELSTGRDASGPETAKTAVPGSSEDQPALSGARDKVKIATLQGSEHEERWGSWKSAALATLPILAITDSMFIVRARPRTPGPDEIQTVATREDPDEPMHSRSIDLGITASFKNTWLLNSTTFGGLEKHTLTATLPDFGKDIGLVVCYNLSPRLSAQAEGMFVSDMGQRYNEYRNGKYVTREIDLQYYTVNFLLKYSRNKMIHDQSSNGHGITGGIFARGLNSAMQTINESAMDMRVNYAAHDYGIIVGYEYYRHLFSAFIVTSGFRVNYGLSDIDAHSWSATTTGSFDVNVAVKYRFGSKTGKNP